MKCAPRYSKPAPNDHLQCWPVSKRVNSSKADANDATLIEPKPATAISQNRPIASETGQHHLRAPTARLK